MEAERTPVVPANRLLEVAGVLSEGASRLHRQLDQLPPAERRALLEVVVEQVGDIVRAWSELVQAVVFADGAEAAGHVGAAAARPPGGPGPLVADPGASEAAPRGAEPPAAPTLAPLRRAPEGGGAVQPAPGALTRDELTGVLNRQAGWAALAREVERARAEGGRYVLGYLNVDGLRQLNEAEGPRAGDELLRKVAAALRATLRSYDVIVRLGGDEFLFGLPGADLATAEQRMRELNVILGEEAPGASVSVGFAELRQDESLDELVVRADDALVQARRRRGRPRLR
jgi:diguanylate cyclase (GGDEF)-like protein